VSRIRLAGLVLAATACAHSEPFEAEDVGSDVPFSSEPPVRLTYSDGDDRTPAWLPDQSGIIYSSERLDEPAHDRCLLVLPPAGGQVTRSICATYPGHADSTDRFESPAVSADGRIAFMRAVGRIGLQKGPRLHFMLGDISDPERAREVTIIPYFAPSGKTHGHISHLQWVSPTRLVYLGENLFYEGSTFFPDTFTTGLEIMRADISGDAVTLSVVSGTELASSVAAGGDEDTIVFTLGGDSKVYRQSLSTGARSVVYDFAGAGIARDVQIRGSTLVAVVGRSVAFVQDLVHGWNQRDEGGALYVVNLDTGASSSFAPPATLFRRPALSPDGRSIVVEASPFALPRLTVEVDFNATNHRPDLWLFQLD